MAEDNRVKKMMHEYQFECGCEIKMTERMDTKPSNCPFHGAPIVKASKIFKTWDAVRKVYDVEYEESKEGRVDGTK